MNAADLGKMLSDTKAENAQMLAFQSAMNTQSKLFNGAMAALDAQKKAWDKVHG